MPHYHYLRYKESTEIYLHGKVDEVFNKLTQSKKTEHFKNIYPVPLQIKTGGCVFLYSEFSVEVDKKRLYIFCRYLEQRESIEEGGVSWAELTSIFPPLPLLCFFARRTSKEHQLSFLPFFASLPPRSPTLPGLSASRGSNRLLKE